MTCPKECELNLERKVPKTWLWKILGTLITIGLVVTGWAFADRDKIRDKVATNEKDIAVVVEHMENIDENIDRMEETQKQILNNQVHAITQMQKIVKDALDEFNGAKDGN